MLTLGGRRELDSFAKIALRPINQFFHLKSGFPEKSFHFRLLRKEVMGNGSAILVMASDLRAAQGVGDNQSPLMLQNPPHLFQRSGLILKMGKGPEANYVIEGVMLIRQMFNGG
jgi:hypothetical protein